MMKINNRFIEVPITIECGKGGKVIDSKKITETLNMNQDEESIIVSDDVYPQPKDGLSYNRWRRGE